MSQLELVIDSNLSDVALVAGIFGILQPIHNTHLDPGGHTFFLCV